MPVRKMKETNRDDAKGYRSFLINRYHVRKTVMKIQYSRYLMETTGSRVALEKTSGKIKLKTMSQGISVVAVFTGLVALAFDATFVFCFD